MSILSRAKSFHLLHLSRPAADRVVYQTIHKHGLRRILEIGVGDAQRARRLIEAAQLQALPNEVHYVGLDLFEARQGGLNLKEAYRHLRSTGSRIQLLPGEPTEAMMQHANALGKVDLLLLSESADWQLASRLWFFVPRLLHADSTIFVERREGQSLAVEPLGRIQLDILVANANSRRAA